MRSDRRCSGLTVHSEVSHARSMRQQEIGAVPEIGVENRDSHYLSQTEIDGAKRISQHLSLSYVWVQKQLEQRH
jgi:hypothetical protein